jgi:hypothetical protein
MIGWTQSTWMPAGCCDLRAGTLCPTWLRACWCGKSDKDDAGEYRKAPGSIHGITLM